MPRWLRVTFLIHAILSLLIGAALLIVPGHALALVNWLPNDPLMTRLVGAALLALAWSSFRGWKASDYAQVAILVEAEAIFTTLGALGLLRHLVKAWYPPIGWVTFGLLAVFAVVWGLALIKRPK